MDAVNTSWILISSALVLLMTLPGLALFYAGLVARKNIISVLAQCFGIAAFSSVLWVIAGYSLAFSGDGAWLGNLDKIFLIGVNLDSASGDIPEFLFILFQMTFAVITPALIVGAVVERIKFSAMLLICGIWVLVVYVPVTHWIWGGGWLAQLGILDFAGGIVVHTTAGVASLVIVKMLGARNTYPTIQAPNSPVFTMIGCSLLWVGWFGFNGGSALGANSSAALAILVTHISAATATITWMFIDWYKNGKPGIVGMATGCIAGLATVTPASGFIGIPGAFILGIVSAIVCYYLVEFIKYRLKLDDTLDVFAVHGAGGILGTLSIAVLATASFGGLGLEKTMLEQFYVQAIGVVSVVIFTWIATYLIVKLTQALVGLRVDAKDENIGLDLSSHGEQSSPLK